jgi:uncharacterized protein (TIGR02118 family)
MERAREHRRSWAATAREVGPLFQLTALYNPPEDPAAFDQHYDNVHADLAKKLPGLQRFTINRPGPDPDGNPPQFYFVAVLEWADENAFQQSIASPEGQAALADLPNFAGAGMTMLTGTVTQYI